MVERVRLLRTYFPRDYLAICTNGAVYNRARHAELAKYASVMTLHVDSLDPEVYAKLMSPLRLPRVLPKIQQIIEDFPNSAHQYPGQSIERR